MAKLLYSLCFVLLTTIVSLSAFGTTLTVSDSLIVNEIDNQIVEHGFMGKKTTFTISQGKHVIRLLYKDVFEDLDFAEERVVKSKEFIVKFTTANEQQLNLTTVAINNLPKAEIFAKSPDLILTDESKNKVSIELVDNDEYKISQQVKIAVNSYASKQLRQKEQKNETKTITKVNKTNKPKVASTTAKIKQKPINTLIQVKALPMLKYWWQNASDEEKEHFKKHIVLHK